eukprot:CAMPEP_0184493594 /NCGR_PEP_ID=MMETSP0113_2-20130426/26433_1 /TAXON_ID=91329 /ORGANISM="Norrisiella sphaerica, Strain BC52" /LENGTH=720 /DNA_ID=CAMNT_0026878913 /DNA_START=20 /DNA_END=2182 /DNA_ORIENTATION=+
MAESSVPWISATQQALGKYGFRKPPLSEKLLKKPPMRYIRDLLVSVQRATGFPKGLFKDEVLTAKGDEIRKWSRPQKVGFLERVHACVESGLGRAVLFAAEKATAGQEPENTNAVLQGFAECADLFAAGKLDIGQVLQKIGDAGWGGHPVEAGDAAGGDSKNNQETAEKDRAEKEAEEKKKKEAREKAAAAREKATKAKEMQARKEAERKAAEVKARAEAEAKREQAHTAEMPSYEAGDQGEDLRVPEPESLEAAVETTKKLLLPFIKKPPLADKYLMRPPAKYILDVCISMTNATGLMQGLFTPEELDPKTYKGADKKQNKKLIAIFIKKMIKFTSLAIGQQLPIKIPDVMRGVEAQKTNMLFHALAKAVKANVSTSAIERKLSGRDPSPASRSRRDPSPKPTAPIERKLSSGDTDEGGNKENAEDKLKAMALKAAAEPAVAMPKLNIGNITSKPSEEGPAAYHAAAKATQEEEEKELRSARPTTRPMTARKAPPKVRSHLVEEKRKIIADVDAESTGLITEDNMGEDMDEDEDQDADDGLGNRQHIDGPDANERHGKLVSDILKFQNKHEKREAEGDEVDEGEAGGSGTQFRFGRLKKNRGINSSNFYSAEQIAFLKDKIQQLCQSATPLGKCIDFVCEDMESMNKELAQWKRSYESECQVAEDAKKNTTEKLHPLREELQHLEAEIRTQREKSIKLQAQILSNEKLIEVHLKSQSGV